MSKDERKLKMDNENKNKLEQRLVEILGEKVSIAVTDARVGDKGYMTRIEAQGIPFTVDAYKETCEESEKLAFEEFNKQLNQALKESIVPTKPADCYEKIELTNEELEKLYKFEELISDDYLKEIKEKTTAKICKLDDGRYECVISSPYMNLHAKSTGGTKTLAVATTIWVAHDIFHATPIKVGNWPLY